MVYTVDGLNYTRRTKILVTGAGSGAQTDYQIKLAALWAAAMQVDFDDVRFTKADMQTLIDAWLESKVDSTSANIWVEFLTTPADGVTKTEAYMYYGLVGAANYWNGNETFIMFDDFSAESPEPLTLYDESGTDLVIDRTTDHRFEYTNVRRDDTAYVYEGISSMSDFCIENHFRITSQQDNSAGTFHCGFADSVGDAQTVTNGLYYMITYPGLIRIWHLTSGAQLYAGTLGGTISYNTDYYTRFTRVGTSVTINVYTDSARTSHTSGSPQSYTDSTPVAFDKFYVFSGRDINHAYNWQTGWTDNYKVRKYVANPPTAAFGSEEHQRRTPMMM